MIRNLPRAALAAIFLIGLLPGTVALAEEVASRHFDDELWTEGLVDLRALDLSRTSLVRHGYVGGGLKVKIPSGGYRGLGPMDRLDPAPQEAWFRYHIRLLDWDAASTGKFPGLAGLYSSSARGCIRPTETSPGWSARSMFGAPGTHGAAPGRVPIGTYLYHVDQTGSCGDSLWWNGSGLEEGRWHCVEGHVRMNTPGKSNGQVDGWLDGQKRLSKSDVRFRRAGEAAIGVRHMWHNVYFGGSWPTPNPLALEYDEVVVSTSGRVKCLQPFTDLSETVHADSIVELHQLGHLYGCDYRKSCHSGELTRGEAAAFISRIMNLPPTNRDFFTDDDQSTFEDVINRLAAARITLGCTANRYCPDRIMSRAEFATMLDRVMKLDGLSPNVFVDDEGHWAEPAINRLAEIGVTKGCGADRFCPHRSLTRGESASFFVRALQRIGTSQPGATSQDGFPPPGDPPPIPSEETD